MLLEAWNTLSLWVGDAVLGWSLHLPRDWTVVVVAVLTGTVMTVVRLWSTDQDRLRRAAADTRRLKELARAAKAAGDKGALLRYQQTRNQVAMVKLRAEGWPLLVSIFPVALLATWGLFRLDYVPPRADQPVTFEVYTPVAWAGQVAHVVPVEGLAAPDGWVRPIEAVTTDGPPYGKAAWTLAAAGRPTAYPVVVRMGPASVERSWVVGQSVYTPPLELTSVGQGADVVTQWQLPQARFLGVVPGVDALFLPPWVVAYVLLVIAVVLAVKKLTGIQ